MTDLARNDVSVGSSLPAAPAAVHCLPCKIDHVGPANVSTYFLPEVAAGVRTSRMMACFERDSTLA